MNDLEARLIEVATLLRRVDAASERIEERLREHGEGIVSLERQREAIGQTQDKFQRDLDAMRTTAESIKAVERAVLGIERREHLRWIQQLVAGAVGAIVGAMAALGTKLIGA